MLYGTRGDLNNAIAAFRYDLYLNLARTYVMQSERERAREVIGQWLRRKPGNEKARQALAALEAK